MQVKCMNNQTLTLPLICNFGMVSASHFVKMVLVVIRNLKTNEVKYAKVYFWKGNFIRDLFSQIFG